MRITVALLFTPALLALTACGDSETSPGTTASSATGAGGAAGSDSTSSTSSTGGAGGEAGGGGSGGAGGTGGTADIDIFEQINAIPGVTATEELSDIDGYRYFMIDFEQPVDHADPSGQHFTQRIMLHHKDAGAPLVLASTGYYLWLPSQWLEEPTDLLDANQLIVEHRYFYPSRPEPADWMDLNIAQAASDHHRIVEAFRPIYEGKWISTGVSKGGMTSIYHRRFFPGDVDGTVAYVAPHSDGLDDPRYAEFLNQVGDDGCRQKLKDFQREVLLRRSSMLTRLSSLASKYNVTFDLIGIEPSLESTVIGLGFAFWQYNGANLCNTIPGAAASDDEVWGFFNNIGLPLYSADPWLLGFEPYYWQAYSELGTPGIDTSHIDDLLLVNFDAIDDLPSIDIDPVHNPAPMEGVGTWLATEGERILFIYGETDPWSAAAFDPGGAKDTHKFVMPGGNHGANIKGLTPTDQSAALDALAAWTGVVPMIQPKILPQRPAPPPIRVMRRRSP
jgi:hypothetical protein